MARRKSSTAETDTDVPSKALFPGKINPMPASPSRPPVGIITASNDEGRRIMMNYSTFYALRIFFDYALDSHPFKQVDHVHGFTNDGIRIDSPQLDAILEYVLTPTDRLWQLPEAHAAMIDRLRTPDLESIRASVKPLKPPSRHIPSAKRDYTPPGSNPVPTTPLKRRDLAGLIPLQTLCDELGINPQHARVALRAAMTKPPHGWAFLPTQLDNIRAIITQRSKA